MDGIDDEIESYRKEDGRPHPGRVTQLPMGTTCVFHFSTGRGVFFGSELREKSRRDAKKGGEKTLNSVDMGCISHSEVP